MAGNTGGNRGVLRTQDCSPRPWRVSRSASPLLRRTLSLDPSLCQHFRRHAVGGKLNHLEGMMTALCERRRLTIYAYRTGSAVSDFLQGFEYFSQIQMARPE